MPAERLSEFERRPAFDRPRVLVSRHEPIKLVVIRLLRDMLAAFPGIVRSSRRLTAFAAKLQIAELARTDSSQYLVEVARQAGAKVGEGCRFYSWVVASEPNLVEIGNGVIISGNVTFVTHDGAIFTELESFPNVNNHYGKIKVGDNCFIGLGTILLPGVELGAKCVVAAGSVIMDSFPAGSVIAGNPARYLCATSMYMSFRRSAPGTVYDPAYRFPLKMPAHLLAERLADLRTKPARPKADLRATEALLAHNPYTNAPPARAADAPDARSERRGAPAITK